MSQLIADLGGCLGLYIGVSVISLMEFSEHFMRCLGFGCKRVAVPMARRYRKVLVPKFLRRRSTRRMAVPVPVQPARPDLSLPPPAPDDGANDGVFSGLSRRRPTYFPHGADIVAAGRPVQATLTAADSAHRSRARADPPAYSRPASVLRDTERTQMVHVEAHGDDQVRTRERPPLIIMRNWPRRSDSSFHEIQQTRQRLEELAKPGTREPLLRAIVDRIATPPHEERELEN
ncbi:amiloride-sensitive sodium channel subunit alpha-like [Tropilaelaps mercedesae]|uniref:Amiloride-sensitive sodium channel subunit alpha-like n=1 Tax=Tropilaelaps mercedesae TaxID=418985 RepID=A0A1V9Y0S3_9ACAR|nr:amiloride-sensitive sodium channel subunit alpha-like [Tropilaelaps mercedesae]